VAVCPPLDHGAAPAGLGCDVQKRREHRLGASDGLQGSTKGAPKVYQGCAKGVPRVCQGCAKGVPRVYQGCAKGVPRVYRSAGNHRLGGLRGPARGQGHTKGNPRRTKGIPRVPQGCTSSRQAGPAVASGASTMRRKRRILCRGSRLSSSLFPHLSSSSPSDCEQKAQESAHSLCGAPKARTGRDPGYQIKNKRCVFRTHSECYGLRFVSLGVRNHGSEHKDMRHEVESPFPLLAELALTCPLPHPGIRV